MIKWLAEIGKALWRRRRALAPWAASFLLLDVLQGNLLWYVRNRPSAVSNIAFLGTILMLAAWAFIGCWYGEKRATQRERLAAQQRQPEKHSPLTANWRRKAWNGEYGPPVSWLPPSLRDAGYFVYLLLLLAGMVLLYKILGWIALRFPDTIYTYVLAPIMFANFGLAAYALVRDRWFRHNR